VSDSPSSKHLIATELCKSKISAILKRKAAVQDILCDLNQLIENSPDLTIQRTATNVSEAKKRSYDTRKTSCEKIIWICFDRQLRADFL
jgi:hypothetical protein